MSNNANKHIKTHHKALEMVILNECHCTSTTLCTDCQDRVGEVYNISHEEYEDIIQSLDAGRSYE